jgi:hypothetical protein
MRHVVFSLPAPLYDVEDEFLRNFALARVLQITALAHCVRDHMLRESIVVVLLTDP